MGKMFGNLTHSAVVSPDGTVAWQASPAAAGKSLAKASAATVQPATESESGDFSQPQSAQPTMVKPSFLNAAQMGATAGGANALSPGLTKGGKLATLLMSGLKGALAGRAADEQTIAATGGRRGGGVGTGFQAGFALPWQEAQQRAQAQLAQGEAQPIQTPYGQMPAGIAAKVISPYLGYQGKIQAQQMRGQTAEDIQGQKSETAQSIQGQKAKSAMDVARLQQGMAVPVDQTTSELVGMPELAGQQVGRSTWTNINKALEARGFRVQDMGQNGTDQNQGMWLMDRAGNRVKQVSPNSLTFQRGASFAQNKPEVVVDEHDPGYAYYTTAAEAMNKNLPAPQGAGTIAAKAEARSEVPTKIGDQKVAFDTMIQHAQLLRQAAAALNNGDVQALAGLKNRFKNQFGYSGPITAEAIADAYKGEVSNVINKGHITDTGNEKVAHTLDPTHQNYATLDGVLGAYESLAQSKLDNLNKQAQASRTPRPRPGQGGGQEIHYKIVNGQLVKQ